MTTHFITAEIDPQEDPKQLHQEITRKLEKRGDPLRWSVTDSDPNTQKVKVEAIVTQGEKK